METKEALKSAYERAKKDYEVQLELGKAKLGKGRRTRSTRALTARRHRRKTRKTRSTRALTARRR